MAFEYRIDGNQVQLTREGAPTVDAKLDRSGLGLDGDVVAIHNGQTVYEGASQPIRIDISANTARQLRVRQHLPVCGSGRWVANGDNGRAFRKKDCLQADSRLRYLVPAGRVFAVFATGIAQY